MNKRIVIVAVPEEKPYSCAGCIFAGKEMDCVAVADVMSLAGLGDCDEENITYQIAKDESNCELPQFLKSQAS